MSCLGMGRFALGLLLAAGFSGCAGSVDAEPARKFAKFPLYWVGERFEKWDISHIDVVNRPWAIFIYGDCKPSSDGGCPPPLDIQVRPLCEHLDFVAQNPIWKRRKVRGAPVGESDGAPVLFTNRVQVKVYTGQGADAGLAMRALRALRSINNIAPVLSPQDPIPAPSTGILEGRKPC